ncbi:MAG: hypothetical protein HXK90_03110 [Lachnospiraceae bacterium]|nr:hypothetical protein [Lachnospiraceae bacterium]
MADRNEYLDGILNNITDLDGQQDPDSLQKHVEKKADSLRKTARNHASLEREFFAAENDLLELNDMLDKADRNVVVSDGLKQLMDHYGEITEQEASPIQIGPSAEETDLRDKEEKSLDDLIAVLEKGSVRHNSGEPLQERDVESSINPRSSSSLPDSNAEQLEEKPLPTIDSVPGMEEITDPQKALRDLNIDVLLDKAEAQMKEQTESADQEEDASSFASASSQEAEKSLTEEIPAEAEESPSEAEESPSEAEQSPSEAEQSPSEAGEVPSETEESRSETEQPSSASEEAFFEREAGSSAEEDSISEVEEDSTSEAEEDSISEVEEDSTPETEESTSQTEEISLHSFLESPEGEVEETTTDHKEHLAPEDLKDSISAQIAAVLSGEDLQASLQKAQTEDGMEQNNPHSEQEETGAEADIPDVGQENHSEEKLSIPEEIKETEVDLKDLDKIMDSLATDHIDDIENEKGQASKEDIEALQAAMMDELGDHGQEEEDSAHPLGKKRKERKKSGQKQGLFARIKALFASLSEDEEEEETADHLTQEGSETKENKAEKDLATGHEGPKEKNPAKEEEQLASLTEENSQVLKELNEEDAQAAEKKKKKKKKPKKEKKPKKAPKPKKPKKAPEPPQGPPPKRIPPKRIILVGVFAVTFGILVYLPSEVFPEPLVVKQAKSSYKKGEYWNTYKDLYGKSAVLTKDQQEEFKKAEVISKMQRYYDEYADYSSVVGKEPEALNALIKGVGRYDEIYKEAKETGDPKVEEEVSNTYDDLVTALQDDYHLTEDLAKQLYAIEDPIEYTIRLQWITGVRGAAEE